MKKLIKDSKVCNLFGGEFELIETGFSTGEYNMDYDLQRTLECSEGKALPMFRFYGWKPWAVSLGANQKEDDIDKNKCNELGFSLVRRPTGGRAVLHANELTYSVVLKMPDDKTVHDVYREIHLILLGGLKKLGCTGLEFVQSQKDLGNFYKQSGMSVSCFASSAKYEISWNNRKVIGSAQRLFGKTLLQHGSILLEYIQSHSITIEEICGKEISYVECLNAMVDNIENQQINYH
ncbi:MAG: hypothetical protein ABSG15_14060 [FCB group bacterium]